jgi:3'-5' exoribonuclease
MDGVVIGHTDEGMLFDHLFIGAEFIGNYADNHYRMDSSCEAKLEMLRHILLSHHGKQEHGAVVVPMSLEAHIVHHADAVDAAAEQIREQSGKVGMTKWTDKIWALGNRPHLTTQYVAETMKFDIVEE